MSIVITSSKDRQEYRAKPIINIGTNPKCDFVVTLDYDILLTVQYDVAKKTCYIANNFKNQNILYNGEILTKIVVDGKCKLTFKNSEEYVEVTLLKENQEGSVDTDDISVSKSDLRNLYDNDDSADIKVKIEMAREPIEKARISIIKQVAFPIIELKNKIKVAWRTSIIMHIAMYFSAILSALAVSNYFMGLTVQESVRHVFIATNIQAWILYSFIIFAICLMLKQGVYLYLNEKTMKNATSTAKIAKNFMLWVSTLFLLGIYAVNLTYYAVISSYGVFALFITLFVVGIMVVLSVSSGYFKANSAMYGALLYKYEYREDFEAVLKAYRIWIERYVNSFTSERIDNIKDRLFILRLKSVGEAVIGIFTAPFLAYGVSNTLAMCFPEAAGWMRISGFRFSPVFLVLATFLIIFAYFAFVNAFTASKKIQATAVIKQDGFNDFRQHGVTILGLEGAKKLESEKKLFLIIGCSIIFIEFMMNISYFLAENSGDIKGAFISFFSALVPTALLIAETMMLSCTRYDLWTCDEFVAKLDKE